jgi:hypothetical protein
MLKRKEDEGEELKNIKTEARALEGKKNLLPD